VYDAYPGGIGLSEPLYRLHDRLLSESRTLIAACPCADGCPSCVGPVGEVGSRGKQVAMAILEAVLDPRDAMPPRDARRTHPESSFRFAGPR
jgi:DEAD/DEAH box helicase domain-containing protein